jgi:Na+-transporting methylmalonyl-CoA/oxaloacetate decarboxylase gamma subunit
MASNVQIALVIALVGMALVFFALLIFYLAMVILMRPGKDSSGRAKPGPEGKRGDAFIVHGASEGDDGALPREGKASGEGSDVPNLGSRAATGGCPDNEKARAETLNLKRRAALAAVAVALAYDRAQDLRSGPKPFPLPPTVLVSTWQAVRRAAELSNKGMVPRARTGGRP